MENSGSLGAFEPGRTLRQGQAAGDNLGTGRKVSFRTS